MHFWGRSGSEEHGLRDDPQVEVLFSMVCDYTAAMLEKGMQVWQCFLWALLPGFSISISIFHIMGNKILLRNFDCSYLWLVLACWKGRTICSVQLTIFVMLWLVFCLVIGITFIERGFLNDTWSKVPSNFASCIFLNF